MAKDYYQILDVEKGASTEEIKKSYKRLAKKHHPDLNKGNQQSAEKFKEINEAASVLGDEKKREQYDRFGTADSGFQGFDSSQFRDFGFDFGDIFDQFFGGGGFSRTRRARRGSDLLFELEVELEDVAKGMEKKINFNKSVTCDGCQGKGGSDVASCDQCDGRGMVARQRRTPFGIFQTTTTCRECQGSGEMVKNTCSDCSGSGVVQKKTPISIKVPAGTEDGMRLRFADMGEAGEKGGLPGDLYVGLHVKPHTLFRRDEDDIHIDIPLDFSTAALGGTIDVPTLDGKVKLKIPSGTQSDTIFTLKGKGIPHLHSFGRGSQNVMVKITVPEKLSKKQIHLLKEFNGKKKGLFR